MKKNLVSAAATAGLIITAFGTTASAQENTYTVKAGDSLWKISHLNDVSIDNLKAWNKLSSDRIYANQKLSINYTIQSGDSLWAIAKSQGTTVSALKKANGLTADLIKPGQALKIPASNINTSSSVPTAPNDTTYVVQKGDTLSEIGARYDLTVSQLKSMNQLTSNKIIIGNILKLRAERTSAVAAQDASASNAAIGAPAVTAGSQTTEPATDTATGSQKVENSAAPVTSTQENSAASAASTTQDKPAAPAASTAQDRPAASAAPATQNRPAASAAPATQNRPAASAAPAAQNRPAAPAAPTAQNRPAAPAAPTAQDKPAAPATAQTTDQPAAPTSQSVQKPAAAASPNAQAVVSEAKKYIGAPYRWGGNTPAGFDCSGFVKYIFAKFGVNLPRTTESQWGAATPVSSPSIGNLVFFQTYKQGPSHVGIYLGNNQFISATDSGVTISNMASSYWGPRYLGARKALQ